MSSNCDSDMSQNEIIDGVKEYYGKTLASSNDLMTNACTTNSKNIPNEVKSAMLLVHEEVRNKYYGCGLVAPECLHGMNILDLGSGSGHDCYVLSKLVGNSGFVTGVDMTEEQLEVARKYIDYHTEKFGYAKPNVKFVKGYLENLNEAGLESDFFDIIISNCVINLVPDKKSVLEEAHRVLKNGGELYFSDVYADCILSDEIRNHKVLWGECISGALYWKQLADLALEIGFSKPCLVSSDKMTVGNQDLQLILGDSNFVSATYRLFKLPQKVLKSCQVIYEGSIPGHEKAFVFDQYNAFPAGDPVSVSSEMASILHYSRFSGDFTIEGSSSFTVAENQKSIDYEKINPFEKNVLSSSGNESCCSSSKCC